MLLLLPGSFRDMRAWRKIMELQKTRNPPKPGPDVAHRKKVTKKREERSPMLDRKE